MIINVRTLGSKPGCFFLSPYLPPSFPPSLPPFPPPPLSQIVTTSHTVTPPLTHSSGPSSNTRIFRAYAPPLACLLMTMLVFTCP